MDLNAEQMREVFRHTTIVRKPTYGVISGYHELPYVCLGESAESGAATTRVSGRIQVSPRFLIRPPQCEPRYEEVFGTEHIDQALVGRVFGFLGFRERPVECKSEHLEVAHLQVSVDHALSDTLDNLERLEDIRTGVIVTPDSRYYPLSIERFISAMLEDEFSIGP